MEATSHISDCRDRKAWRYAWARAQSKRYLLNTIFAFAAVALEVYYSICGGACSYLKGDVFGLPLQYIGIAYMAALVFFSVLRQDLFLVLLLSAGVGIELYLIGFQIWYDTYCPYCLAFAGIVIFLFFLNFDRARTRLSCISMGVALALFSIFFQGSATPSYAGEVVVPSFGEGKVNVRLYTDYFCPPCRAMEPDIEPVLTDLLKKKIITLTFVDTPIYKMSPLYARCFLYAVNAKKELDYALAARRVLIEASKDKLESTEKIEALLKEKGIPIKPFDTKSSFDTLSGYLKEDQVRSTPTCVIDKDGKKETLIGAGDILAGLNRLKPTGEATRGPAQPR